MTPEESDKYYGSGFGDAFDAHDLKATYERLAREYRERSGFCIPRSMWPDLPSDVTAHDQRQWLGKLTVGDAAMLKAMGIDPLG